MKKAIFIDNVGEQWVAPYRMINTLGFYAENVNTGERKLIGSHSEYGFAIWNDLDIERTLTLKEVVK
jgi:hypothetical protein